VKGARLLRYFRGVFASDNLPRGGPRATECGIINLQERHLRGTHWCAYYAIEGRYVLYFDSFALPPIKAVLAYFKNRSIHYNIEPVQRENEYICGHFALAFLYFIQQWLFDRDNAIKVVW